MNLSDNEALCVSNRSLLKNLLENKVSKHLYNFKRLFFRIFYWKLRHSYFFKLGTDINRIMPTTSKCTLVYRKGGRGANWNNLKVPIKQFLNKK